MGWRGSLQGSHLFICLSIHSFICGLKLMEAKAKGTGEGGVDGRNRKQGNAEGCILRSGSLVPPLSTLGHCLPNLYTMLQMPRGFAVQPQLRELTLGCNLFSSKAELVCTWWAFLRVECSERSLEPGVLARYRTCWKSLSVAISSHRLFLCRTWSLCE